MAESNPPRRSTAVRRNGTLQSCEPCRKAKLRCDHAKPVCGRCLTKNMTARCFYHPAPMTKRGVSGSARASPVAEESRRRRPRRRLESPVPLVTSEDVSLNVTPLNSPEPFLGYMGSTSYSAVLQEHRDDLPFELNKILSTDTPTRSSDAVQSTNPARLQCGLDLLKLLYSLPICEAFIRKFYAWSLVAIVPLILLEAIMESLRVIFDNLDTAGDVEAQLRAVAHRIFERSARPLTSNGSMSVREYCDSFTGDNLRWEALGIIFATAGIASMVTPDSDPELVDAASDGQSKERIRAQIVEASNVCLELCDHPAAVNELLVFYRYNDVMLKTQQYGDTSFQAWRRLSDLASTVYAAGLHQESIRANDCPPFLQEWRRICFAASFYADKCVSTFTGRPPCINYRYCTLTPPLDVTEDELVAGGDTFTQAVSQLDMAGWHPRQEYTRAGMIRLRFLVAVFREKALEIALGTCEHWDLVHKANEIIDKARATWEACPGRLRYDARAMHDSEPYFESFTLLHIYLDHLHTIFLLQRSVVKQTNSGHDALFGTARHVLSIITRISADRDPVMDMTRHYAWITLYYGLPSASVLMLELLHQTRDVGPRTAVLPRAEVIRNLSIFVSSLSWVARPGQGNYHTCKEVEKKLSHILDQILDPQPIQGEVYDDATSGLYNFLDWYNPNGWDFGLENPASVDGFLSLDGGLVGGKAF
ncbi:putative C6 transcription factor [Aspergillus candidus]|uniref:Putative C6 transcription factor n=1 Tax=Aspergillus candidus TaxID=41067 RepID=A0A2I2FJI8_ASPCN|nr:putative C6 transcription factor [Aspergillus candidus]PLB40807.1 putative C6 transcription factor [Aspergillus candidus]